MIEKDIDLRGYRYEVEKRSELIFWFFKVEKKMPVRYKSEGRALKRGHLRINHREVQDSWEDSLILGVMTPKMIKIPFLERRTNKGTWVSYKF